MLSLLLSALVLACGTVPPGFRHAHLGGADTGHRHGDGRPQTVAHHASHEHDSDADHREHATVPDTTLLSDFVIHLHWRFLGMDFSIPEPDEPAPGNDDEGTAPPAIVRAMDGIVPATQVGPSFGRVLLAVICTPSADVVQNRTPPLRSPDFTTSIPLCDSARLERTGVLLA